MALEAEVEIHDFYNELLRALYTELTGDPPSLFLRSDLSREEREALEVEASSYLTGRRPRGGRMLCYQPSSYEAMSRTRINAYRRIVEKIKPNWVEQVRMATLMDNDLYTIVHLSGVPPYPAVAILENMKERGELAGG